MRRQLATTDWPTTNQPYVTLVCRFNGLHLSNLCKYMGYYSFTDHEGMEGLVGLVGCPIAYTLPTKLLRVHYIVDQGKFASQKPTS